jgi:hypothetical protein
MMALEDHFGQGVIEIVQTFQQDAEAGKVRMGTLVSFLAQCAGDGAGVSTEEAQALFDALGTQSAAELMGECIEKAFPEAKEQAPAAKNPKRASRKK